MPILQQMKQLRFNLQIKFYLRIYAAAKIKTRVNVGQETR